MDERDRVAVVSANRDREAVPRHRAGEGNRARVRREHGLARLPAEVDPAVLPAEIRVAAEAERA
jgi:hypothetical protein